MWSRGKRVENKFMLQALRKERGSFCYDSGTSAVQGLEVPLTDLPAGWA